MLTRRAVMMGVAGIAAGVMVAGCDDGEGSGDGSGSSTTDAPTSDPSTTDQADDEDALPTSDELRMRLRDLVDQTGLDSFQRVSLVGSLLLSAVLATEDGGQTRFAYDSDAWDDGEHEEATSLSSPSSRPLADLPVDQLPDFAEVVGESLRGLDIIVDHAGHIRVTADDGTDERVGLLLDGSGLVSQVDIETAEGVRTILAELVADYGTSARQVGSFNGFVHMDANVEGIDFGLRIVRYPTSAAQASSGTTELYPEDALFDPTGMDPTIVLATRDSIMETAELPGTVWDWSYRRPPQGGEPMFCYGVGESGPSQTIWINPDGSIAEIVNDDCEPAADWCTT